jgi:hypothetical protein
MERTESEFPAEPQARLLEVPEGPGSIPNTEATPGAVPPEAPTCRRCALQIPDDLLEAARHGMTTREVARILSTRVDQPVSRQRVYGRLLRLGVRRPDPVRYETRSGEVVLTAAEYERLDNYHRRREAHVRTLLTAARSGDRDALTRLHDQYGLRLPLVEARISPPLPWRLNT